MNEAAEIIGRLHEAVEYLKLDRGDEYLMLEASEIDMNLWAEIRNLRELADKCGAKA